MFPAQAPEVFPASGSDGRHIDPGCDQADPASFWMELDVTVPQLRSNIETDSRFSQWLSRLDEKVDLIVQVRLFGGVFRAATSLSRFGQERLKPRSSCTQIASVKGNTGGYETATEPCVQPIIKVRVEGQDCTTHVSNTTHSGRSSLSAAGFDSSEPANFLTVISDNLLSVTSPCVLHTPPCNRDSF